MKRERTNQNKDEIPESIQNELQPKEKIEKYFSPHPTAYLGWYLIGGLLILMFTKFFISLGVIIILITELVRRANKYIITNKRVIHQYTFLSKKTSSTLYNKLQDVHLTQNIDERIFRIGKIHLNTAGSHNIEIIFKGVKNPTDVKKIIMNNMMKKKV